MKIWMLSQIAGATTFLPPPSSLTDQLTASSLAGEYTVVSATVVMFEGMIPTTHVLMAPITTVRGPPGEATVILPGALVDGIWLPGSASGVTASAGDTLFLLLEHGLEGFENLRFAPTSAFFRRVETVGGPKVLDGEGRIVVDLPCEALPTVAVVPEEQGGISRADVILVDDPESIGIGWDEAIASWVRCGEAP